MISVNSYKSTFKQVVVGRSQERHLNSNLCRYIHLLLCGIVQQDMELYRSKYELHHVYSVR